MTQNHPTFSLQRYTELSQSYQALVASETQLRQNHLELTGLLAQRDQLVLELQSQLQQQQQTTPTPTTTTSTTTTTTSTNAGQQPNKQTNVKVRYPSPHPQAVPPHMLK